MPLAFELVLPLLMAAFQPAAEASPAAVEDGPVTRQAVSRDTPLLDFDYVWPEAASADPRLVAYLTDDSTKTYDQAVKDARENKIATEKYGGPFNQNLYARTWTLAGQSKQLISLVAGTDTFTGGAHPNHSSRPLLWDRSTGAGTTFGNLFQSPDGLQSSLRPQSCKLLDAERLKRRQGEIVEGEFSECPEFHDLTIVPADENGNGRFDRVDLIADPYVAGPYVEGKYEVSIAVGESLIAALRPEFRGDFEAQPPQ